ncbi:arylsulfatase A family protein [Blastopirellula marina]|uniref:Arylsulfatase A family protein n=1 Tax=Blastopirellula marina TaxID=124 RepID=A0A2S8G2R2_9BACT|nr:MULTISPECIES: sulfatase [Pirellulaceae]PQO38739.1 arylsulfatase A family protein [Blastopirellula marina]RCS55047.1 arylsulfatase A family protein [Bremerella cremea]
MRFALLGVLLFACSASQLFAAELPDIVLFLSDDHTIGDSSLYGSPDLKTPNMERIAKQGLTFDQAFVASPSCAPSRAALLTGLMPSRNGAEPNHSRPKPEIKKLPAYFQELGYEVVSFGKVGHYRQTPEYGFDIARHFNYHEDVAVPEALKWLNARESDKPLLLFVGTNWPHVPWPEPENIDPASIKIPLHHVHTPQTRAARARYYQAIKTMDRELGEVFDAAYAKLGEDTLFLHTSDHGAQWPFGKWTLYDEGIRTPMIAVWPGKIAPGKRTDAMVSWIDILPTLYAAVGQTPPEELDGRSFLPVLLGERDSHRDVIFTVHSGDGNHNVYPTRSIRTPRWKYIRNLHPEFKFTSHILGDNRPQPYWGSWVEKAKTTPEAARKVKRYLQRPAVELYDLEADPTEQNNLATNPDHADTLAKLSDQLDAWMKKQGDQQKVFGEPILLEE